MKLKLDQIERLAFLLNHLTNVTSNIRCDRYGGLMEVRAWSSDMKKLERVEAKTGIQACRKFVGPEGTVFFQWRI